MVNRPLFSGLLAFGLALAAVAVVPAEGPAYIPLIAKGSAQDFWQAVMKGAQKAAQDYDVVVTFEGPEDESMVDRQVEMLSAALARNPSAVCIAALDSAAVIPLLQKARAAKIPVIGFDTGVDSPLAVTTAATDNVAAAALAADKMAALIGGWGKVGVVAEDQTSRTAMDRTDGFLRAMRKFHRGIHVIAPRYPADFAPRYPADSQARTPPASAHHPRIHSVDAPRAVRHDSSESWATPRHPVDFLFLLPADLFDQLFLDRSRGFLIVGELHGV
jgi:ribose transport system substrate-binding protein